jgi:RNA polymerase sigma factor (sigma-70 family)
LEDVENEAWIGLTKAVQKYRPELGKRFEHYAWTRIYGHLLDVARVSGWFGGKWRTYRVAVRRGEVRPVTFHRLDGDWFEGREEEPGRGADAADLYRLVCSGLSMKERVMLRLYYGESWHMREVAAAFGVSESKVSHMHTSVLDRMTRRARWHDWAGT